MSEVPRRRPRLANVIRADVGVGARTVTTLAPGATELQARRGGITRVTTARTVDIWCRTCGRDFPTTGTGWSHAASARHVVDVSYAVEFTFAPTDEVGP